MTNVEKLTGLLESGRHIVFFGGAGVSTESGIPDFRSASGLYNLPGIGGFTPEQVISHSFFMAHTAEFYDFYCEKLVFPDAMPNAAHLALARLEESGKLDAVVTQNIDGLHQKAGSKKVFELHGSVLRNYCVKCGRFHPVEYILDSRGVPRCESCGGLVKPDVVLYEESLDTDVISGAVEAISRADTLIVGGTSLVVYPAAGFVRYFNGKNLILINKSSTQLDSEATLVIHEPIGEVLGKAVRLE